MRFLSRSVATEVSKSMKFRLNAALRFSARSTLLLLSLVLTMQAQTNTGSMSGTILDPNGAVIADASVLAVGDNTGQEFRATTTASGRYTFPSLPVGPYTVTVEHPGFRKLVQSGNQILVASRVSLDLKLQIGESSQSVQVTTDAPLLSAASSDLGTNFQPKFMKDAPLFVSGGFRSPENFISYLPGVNNGAQDSSINGGSRRSKEILIDGASHTNPESGGVSFTGNGGLGSVEMFGEFKLLTGNFSAEYGRSGGGIEIFVTKSGTNVYHGTVFDYLRNDAMDSAGWSVNQRRPFLGKSKIRQNEYGVAFGGPVWIPKIYNGKNRTFFYFTWNGYRQNGASGVGVASIATQLMKQGDFSELGNKLIYDPATTTNVNGVDVRTPFPGNRIPTNRFSSVSSKILPLIPNPTGAGISSNFNTVNSTTVDRNIYSFKGDHSFSDRNRLSVLYTWQRLYVNASSGLPLPLSAGSVTADKPDTTRVNHDFTFAPSLLNHATFGLSRYQNVFQQLPEHRAGWPEKLGLTGVVTGEASSFPIVNFSDGLTAFGNDPKNVGAQQNYTYEFSDSLSWNKGKHAFKFGGSWHKGRTFQNPPDQALAHGRFRFFNNETALPSQRATTGYGFASFLLGAVDNAERDFYTKGVDIKYKTISFYGQDDWKITSKLILNLGIRWEIYVPRTDTNLTLSAFDPTIPNPAANNVLGALAFAGTGPGRTGRQRFGDIYYNNFGPRLGLAYQWNDKTVIRGGYGMYFSAANGNTGGGCFPCGWGTSASPTPTTADGYTPVFNWDQGFQLPAGFKLPPVIDPSYANGQTVLAVSKEDGLAGRIQNWSVNIQRELPKNVLLDVAYAGTYGTRLNNYVALNQVNPKYLSLGSLLQASITSPAVVAAGFKKPYDSFPSNGILSQALRPYPQYNNIIHTYLGQGSFTYNALQAKVEKRFSALTLLAGYTWSRNLSINGAFTQTGNGTAPQDAYNLANEKSLSVHDIPHALNLIYTYDLPFGKGHKYLSGSNTVVRMLVGGWTIAGIHQYRSGTLIAINSPTNTLGAGVLYAPALRAITTGQPILTGINRTDLDPNNPATRYLNRAAFAIPGQFQFGTAAPYLNAVRNPIFLTENFSLVKRTKIGERIDIETRADASNVLNRTVFGGINVNLSDANFGRPTGVQNGPRILQVAMKVNF